MSRIGSFELSSFWQNIFIHVTYHTHITLFSYVCRLVLPLSDRLHKAIATGNRITNIMNKIRRYDFSGFEHCCKNLG